MERVPNSAPIQFLAAVRGFRFKHLLNETNVFVKKISFLFLIKRLTQQYCSRKINFVRSQQFSGITSDCANLVLIALLQKFLLKWC